MMVLVTGQTVRGSVRVTAGDEADGEPTGGRMAGAIEPTVRESTFYSYRRNLDLHVLPYIGGVVAVKVDGSVLNGLYGQLLATGRRDRSGGLSRRTVAYVHTITHRPAPEACSHWA
jgi:hypothetical protein